MAQSLDHLISRLAEHGRILLLGGLAIIAHGLSRATRDADIWLEPFTDARQWSAHLAAALATFTDIRFHNLRTHQNMPPADLPAIVEQDGVIRILGADRPLDVFRHPHNLDMGDFDGIWDRATMLDNGIRLPDAIDLLPTKENTSRAQDAADLSFLETKIRHRLTRDLATCTPAQAQAIFQRYFDHETCRAALSNPHPLVKARAHATLLELAASGDPFAQEILNKLPAHESGI